MSYICVVFSRVELNTHGRLFSWINRLLIVLHMCELDLRHDEVIYLSVGILKCKGGGGGGKDAIHVRCCMPH